MRKNIKEFIEKHIDLIDKNEWSQFYKLANETSTDPNSEYLIQGELTKVFLSAGINPLEYLTYIPSYYFESMQLDSVVIPDSIKLIADEAFAECDIQYLELPKTIKMMSEWAFLDARVREIHYKGTVEEWNKIDVDSDWKCRFLLKPQVIKATNGEIPI